MKDRARPFSRKHRRYWMTVTGGMIIIMSINLGLGVWMYRSCDSKAPAATYYPIPAPSIIYVDAGVDASLPHDVER
jgi:hypothetical protein